MVSEDAVNAKIEAVFSVLRDFKEDLRVSGIYNSEIEGYFNRVCQSLKEYRDRTLDEIKKL